MATRYIDTATLTDVPSVRKIEHRPGELARYITADGRIWRYFGSTRSVTYLKEEK